MDKTFSVALLSYGMSGKVFHAPFISTHDGFRLTGAWERSKKQIESDYPGAQSFDSLEELLSAPIDLVVVNTPTSTHFEYAKQALEAGKHVVVEKAFTTTAAEAIALAELANKVNRSIAVFQNRRWDSDFLAVREVLASGKIGEVVEAQFGYDRYNPALSAKAHKEIPSAGAGVLKDLGPHLIDQALVAFGVPEAVFADLRITREHSQVNDYFELLLYYPRTRVRLHSGYFNREPIPAYVIHGTHGSFHHHRTDVQEAQLQAGVKTNLADWGVDASTGLLHCMDGTSARREELQTPPGNYMKFYDGVYQCLSNGSPMPVTAQDGINVMQIIEAAELSAREGRLVRLTA